MRNYTDITVILDRSGSMQVIKDAMENGLRELVGQHRKNKSTRFSLIQFDGQNPYDVKYLATPIREVGDIRLEPRGWTPLYDCLGRAIDEQGARFARMAESERPSNVLFMIITDGQENYSRNFNQRDIKQRIETQRDIYKWDFTFLGTNQDAITEARKMGIDYNRAINFGYNAIDTQNVMNMMATKSADYATARSRGLSDDAVAATLNWVANERITATATEKKSTNHTTSSK